MFPPNFGTTFPPFFSTHIVHISVYIVFLCFFVHMIVNMDNMEQH